MQFLIIPGIHAMRMLGSWNNFEQGGFYENYYIFIIAACSKINKQLNEWLFRILRAPIMINGR